MGGKTSTASKRKYNDKTYQRIVLDVLADSQQCKEEIQQAAAQAGESLTAYVVEAIRRRMAEDGYTPGLVKKEQQDVNDQQD